MRERPYQLDAIRAVESSFAQYRSALIVLPTGAGKCLGRGTPVMKHSGHVVPVEQIRAGDLLMGPDGKPRRVESTCQGREMMYRIVPTKGDPYIVNESHILSLKRTNERRHPRFPCQKRSGEIVNIALRDYLKKSKSWRHLHKGWRTGIEFPGISHLLIDPYFLGLWLGDGNSRHSTITTGDHEVIEFLKRFAVRFGMTTRAVQNSPGSLNVFIIGKTRSGRGGKPIHNSLRYYDLILNKHIPHDYKVACRSDRLALLAGIIDSDGSKSGGGYDVCVKCSRLAKDIVFVARSLGFAAYLNSCKKKCHNNGKVGTYWRISISGDLNSVPVKVPRKKCPSRRQKKSVLMTGLSVEPLGEDDYFGFTLSGPDRLFLLGDFTVTHNTIIFAHLCNRMMGSGRCMILAHREELITQAAAKVRAVTGIDPDIEMAERYANEHGHFRGPSPIVVSSIQTQNSGRKKKRMQRFDPGEFSLLVIDEAHHAPAKTYRNVVGYYEQNPNLRVLGVTATPDRTDELALGQVFKDCPFIYGIEDAIADGWLVGIEQQYVVCGDLDFSSIHTTAGDLNQGELAAVVEEERALHEMVGPTIKIVGDRKTLFFATSVLQAERTAEIFNRHRDGMARCVFGHTPKDERRATLVDYARDRFQVLVNVGVATEGFDEPGIEVVAVGRPTKSRALYCLDEATEVLTKSGWSKNVMAGELVAAFDPQTEEIKYVQALASMRRPMEAIERWVSIRSPSLDIRVTDNHRMLYDNSRRTGWKFKTAAQLASLNSGFLIPIAGTEESEGLPLSDDELRFIAWVMTDGSINKCNGQIQITQGEHQPWLEEIQRVISACGFKHNRFVRDRVGAFKQSSKAVVWTISKGIPRGRDKHLSGWGRLDWYLSKEMSPELLRMSARQFEVFVEALHLGDGSKQVGQYWTRRSYHICSANRVMADRLQILSVTRGWKANISTLSYNQNPIYMIHIKKKNWSSAGSKYDGRPVFVVSNSSASEMCWCVQNEIGTLVTRRNGKVAIVGNCQMIGRSTRPLGGLVDSFDTAEARRKAILSSRKPKALILDFVGNSGQHKLVSVADVLGGKYVDDDVAAAKELAEQAGKPKDMTEALEEARQERLIRQLTEASKRARIRAEAQYKSREVDPFGRGDHAPKVVTPKWYWKHTPATDKQKSLLHKRGIDTEGLTIAEASQLIDEIASRENWRRRTG